MSVYYHQHRKVGPFLLAMSCTAWLLELFAPEVAWPIGATALVAASVFIRALGIRQFLALYGITIGHFVTLAPAPYGRGELPLVLLLQVVIIPFTIASAAIAIWYWRSHHD